MNRTNGQNSISRSSTVDQNQPSPQPFDLHWRIQKYDFECVLFISSIPFPPRSCSLLQNPRFSYLPRCSKVLKICQLVGMPAITEAVVAARRTSKSQESFNEFLEVDSIGVREVSEADVCWTQGFELREDPDFWKDHNVQVFVSFGSRCCLERVFFYFFNCFKEYVFRFPFK